MYQNPYMMQQYSTQQIITVNGEPGARAYQMNPNSSALLLDENDPIVWVKRTDSAGYGTLTPYRIEEIKPKPQVDLGAILERLERIEERMGRNEKSNSKSVKAE